MDNGLNNKRVLNAVAGSGKTSYIIDQLSLDTKRSLIITYTTANQENLKEKVINKFGYLPSNIFIYGYFEFLLKFIIKPLCPYAVKDICFEIPNFRNPNPFTNNKNRIYANKMAKYIQENLSEFKQRIDRYFDEVYIDEMQDLASDDFKWMLSLSDLQIPVTLVGDFFQSTFASSRRGNHLKNLYKDFSVYKKTVEEAGYYFDTTTLINSYRCTSTVCNFIKEKIGINIESANSTSSSEIRLITEVEEIRRVLENSKIQKLFYQNAKKFDVNGDNWGNSKGMTFNHVCIILNDTTYKKYDKNELSELAPQTLCKFYVACTRTMGDLWFIKEKDIPTDYKVLI